MPAMAQIALSSSKPPMVANAFSYILASLLPAGVPVRSCWASLVGV